MVSVNGSALAVRETLERAIAGTRIDEAQLDMLGQALPVGVWIGREDGERVAQVAQGERKAGRPPGSTNLATRELRKALHAMGLDSVWEMARWALLSPEELAARLRCTVAEAFDRKLQLLDRIAPYQHARLAPTDDAGNVVPDMVMVLGGRAMTGDMAKPGWGARVVSAPLPGTLPAALPAVFPAIVENQGVSEADVLASNNDASNWRQ